ncbi:Uncharacterized protein YjbI, contains pentapeptide repeats [Filimonas lacunae]|uniref:Uncharacterized protein YjbI, contains pentapeptide repeats n=1 Tax=Filimonas lacunae TaxID=477680 RepID=A0A173M992_9BACT|nr:pentapeptide repeat-containing protein [Filimonas lacunae]BAV04089.1 related to MCBG protein [Filimonas lacunae]SIT15569.1 Uncharacterized protein YjbI, contains pentapeptide repeats [Filimonas lacunae]
MGSSNDPVVHQNKVFSNVDYTEKTLTNREFVHCEFINCLFTKSDLRNNEFESCHFKQCNFSMAQIAGAGFRDAVFTECKIMGVDFTQCNKFLFSFTFHDCQLDYCIFLGTKLKKTLFRKCSLKEVEFSDADLSASVFDQCDMANTRFSNTQLEKADFRTAYNFSIDPEINKLKKARFTANNLAGLLDKYHLDIND